MEQWILPFYAYLQDAVSAPQDVELETLWEWFDLAIADLDDQAKLKVAGEAICQIAAVFAAKTGMALEEVMANASQDGPMMRLDEFEGYVRQTMQIDLDRYVEPLSMLDVPAQVTPPWSGLDNFRAYQEVESSIVSEISTSTLEEWIELLQTLTDTSEASEMEKIKQLSHGENIEAWSEQLRVCLEKLLSKHKKDRAGASLLPKAIAFLDLVKKMKMPASEVWLAFLLGEHDYQLRRKNEDFYSAIGIDVVIKQ